MAKIIGYNNILQSALPSGLDAQRISQYTLRERVDWPQFMARVAGALAQETQDLINDYGDLFYLTTTPYAMYPDGTDAGELPIITDQSRPDPVTGRSVGHMYETTPYGRSVGGTRRYFRDLYPSDIRSNISTIAQSGRNTFVKSLFTRAFTNSENQIGSAGYDVPFCAGTSSNVSYTPLPMFGRNFAANHNHFIAKAPALTAANAIDNLMGDMVATLIEHGHATPLTAYVSYNDVSKYADNSNFRRLINPGVQVIQRGGETDGPRFFASGSPTIMPRGAFGYYESRWGSVELRSSYRIPANYLFMYKSYGQLDERNPLAVLVHPEDGFGFNAISSLADETAYPTFRMNIEMEFGVGVGNDRTNGSIGQAGGATFANPTIT